MKKRFASSLLFLSFLYIDELVLTIIMGRVILVKSRDEKQKNKLQRKKKQNDNHNSNAVPNYRYR